MKVIKGKIWAALGSFMDHASTAASKASSVVADRVILADIEAAIERCTDGHDVHVDDRHVHEILFLVSNAPGAITFLSRRITARLEGTRVPTVALKSLLLVHRLLRGGDRYFEQDLRNLWSSHDLRIDAPRCSDCLDGAYSFLHGYSSYLEERMGWMINQGGNLEPIRPSPQSRTEVQSFEEEATESLLLRLSMCQRLLDQVIQLLPDNNSSSSLVARSAFGIVLRESFRVYESFKEGLEMVVRSCLLDLSKPLRISAHDILKKACTQTPELCEFYQKCKRSNVGKSLDYPLVRVVTPAQISAMEQLLHSEFSHDQQQQQEHKELGQPSTLFARKLETTISTVWVEFSEEDFLVSNLQQADDTDDSAQSMQTNL